MTGAYESLYKNKFGILLSSVGSLGALIYAFKVKSGFWKGFGYTLLGGIFLGSVGYGIDVLVNGDDQEDATLQQVVELNNYFAVTDSDRDVSVYYQMNQQELNDVYKLFQSMQTNTEITDSELKQRLNAISVKYNIFT
jgi:hypothetical protein